MLLSQSAVFAQRTTQKDELVSTLSKLAASAARGYVAPIVSGFGADLNSGWIHRVPDPVKASLDLEFGVVGMGSFFSASSKSFSSAGPFKFNHDEADLLIPRSYTGAFRDSIDDPHIVHIEGREQSPPDAWIFSETPLIQHQHRS